MIDSAVVNKDVNTARLDDRAFGFRRQFFFFGKPVEYDLNHLDGMAGDGNIYASARDLLIWSTALQEGTLLPKEVIQQLYQPNLLRDGAVINDSYQDEKHTSGLGTYRKNGDTSRAYANGGWRGFLLSFSWDREPGDTLMVLSNSGFRPGTFVVFDKLENWVRNLE